MHSCNRLLSASDDRWPTLCRYPAANEDVEIAGAQRVEQLNQSLGERGVTCTIVAQVPGKCGAEIVRNRPCRRPDQSIHDERAHALGKHGPDEDGPVDVPCEQEFDTAIAPRSDP